jgi:putative nucleotidyltransferase with HDIG domain
MRVAQLARKIAEIEGADERLVEQTFTAGLLHDVGKLILADNPSIKYLELMARAKEEGRQLVEVEEGTLHATHAEVGAYLLDLWGLPAPLVETVALHHQPAHSAEPGFTSLTAVHVANVLEQETAHETTAGPVNRLDLAYLERLGLGARVEVWRKQLSQG